MVKAILFNLESKVLDKLFFSIGGRDMVHCEESGEEISEMESVYALKCHISHEVNHLHEGLKHENASLHCTPVYCGMVRSYLVKLVVKLPREQKP
ncbi:hypothetical protein CsSME_00036207 [Camellia sinensis var. sinensis]